MLCYLRLMLFLAFPGALTQNILILIPGIFRQEAPAALLSIPQHQRIKGGHVVSASSKPSQQLVTALWPECSGASTPRQCGFSPHSGDNGLSRAAWLAVHRVICRMSASAESRPVLAGWRGRGVSFR